MAVSSKGTKGNEIVFGVDDVDTARNKFKSKKEFRISRQVHDRIQEMAEGRRKGCPFPRPLGGGSGTNWTTAWKRWMRQYLMWRKFVEGRSNLKSSISFSAVETFMNEFQEVHNAVIFKPTPGGDPAKVRRHAEIERYWESSLEIDAPTLQALTAKDTAIYGTQIPFNGWRSDVREVEMFVTGDDIEEKLEELMKKKVEETKRLERMSVKEIEKKKIESQREKLAEIEKMLEETKPFVEKQKIIDFEDVVYVPTELEHIYVDENAITLRGPSKEAIDIAWLEYPSEGQFKTEFANIRDPFVIKANVKKVKGGVASLEGYSALGKKAFYSFQAEMSDKQIQLIRYYNKITDSYVILANDIVIRSGPLPYNHKQLPFSRHRLFPLKNSFYGFGFPGALEYVQAEIEATRNLNLDSGKARLQPSVFINDDIFDDVDQGWEVGELSKKIPVSGSVGDDNIRWFEGPQFNMDYYQMNSLLEQEGIRISGMNPAITGLTAPSERVRNNLTNLESSLKSVRKLVKNYMVGWRNSAWQRVFLRIQFLSADYIRQVQSESWGNEEGKTLISVGEITEAEGAEAEEGENAKDLIKLDKINMQLNIDALAPVSQGLKIQNADKAFATMLPILEKPELLSNPLVLSLIRELFEANGFSKKPLEFLREETTVTDAGNAEEQGLSMMQGESIPGIPGESLGHTLKHAVDLIELLSERERLDPTSTSVEDLDHINLIIDLFGQHLAIDLTQKGDAPEAALAASQPQPTPQPIPSVPEQAVQGMDMEMGGGLPNAGIV